MSSASTPRFDAVTLWLHWITVILVVVQFVTALSLKWIDPGRLELVLSWHRSTGLLLWGLTAFRVLWRATLMRVPLVAPHSPRLQRLVARANESAVYLLLLVQPGTGLAESLFRARPVSLFGMAIPVLVAKSKPIYNAAERWHELGAWIFAGLIGLHATAALFHRLVLHDGVLQSMLPSFGAPKPTASGARPSRDQLQPPADTLPLRQSASNSEPTC